MYNCSPVGLRGRQLKIVAGNPPKGELFHGLERADFLVLEPVPKLSFARLPFCSTFHTHTHTHIHTHTHTYTHTHIHTHTFRLVNVKFTKLPSLCNDRNSLVRVLFQAIRM